MIQRIYTANARPVGPPVYQPPYPTSGLLLMALTKYGRDLAVEESAGGTLTRFVNKAPGKPIPDLVGFASWTDQGIAFGTNNYLTVNTGNLPQLTLVLILRSEWYLTTGANGSGMVLAKGTPDNTAANPSSNGFLLYSGFGGNAGVIKYFAGGSYIEGANIGGSGKAVIGISYFANGAYIMANRDTRIVAGGTAGLKDLRIDDPNLLLEGVLLYDHAKSLGDLAAIGEQVIAEEAISV